jgi:hypothetical protein
MEIYFTSSGINKIILARGGIEQSYGYNKADH